VARTLKLASKYQEEQGFNETSFKVSKFQGFKEEPESVGAPEAEDLETLKL
jgi:hypothetical protein